MWRQGKKLTQVARLWALDLIHHPRPYEALAPAATATANALAHFGVVAVGGVPEPTQHPKFCLWPCNQDTWRIWSACSTQWMDGMNGRTGLNYQGVEAVMRLRFGLRGKKAQAHFAYLQSMEIEALNAWTERRAQQ